MKQFVIIGIGKFGYSIATTLFDMGHDVLAIDKDEEKVQQISNRVTHAVQADATDENTLKALGIRNFDVAVVTISSNIQSSILITMLCKELGLKYVLAKAQNELHAKVLYKTGADKVVFPERDMGIRVAQNLVSTNFLDYIELTPHYRLVELAVVPAWEDKSLRELNIRVKYGINIMAIRHGNDVNISPLGDDILRRGDVLVLIGRTNDIENFQRKAGE